MLLSLCNKTMSIYAVFVTSLRSQHITRTRKQAFIHAYSGLNELYFLSHASNNSSFNDVNRRIAIPTSTLANLSPIWTSSHLSLALKIRLYNSLSDASKLSPLHARTNARAYARTHVHARTHTSTHARTHTRNHARAQARIHAYSGMSELNFVACTKLRPGFWSGNVNTNWHRVNSTRRCAKQSCTSFEIYHRESSFGNDPCKGEC